MKIKRKTRLRLTMLATYLESLPKKYVGFEMESFFTNTTSKDEAKYARKNGGVTTCGAVACAVGHGPAAGILFPKHLVEEFDAFDGKTRYTVDWSGYAGEMFTDDNNDLFDWMFSGDWSDVDNHHWGAAARIRYTLAGLPIPDDCDYPKKRHRKLYREFDKRHA